MCAYRPSVTSLLYLILQIRPLHVKEACRLLNKSIIRVEQPDIQLEQDEDEEMAMGRS